jgi:hypothetical protein
MEMTMGDSPQKLSEVYSEETCIALAEAYRAWKKDNQLSSGYFSINLDNQVTETRLS